MTRIKTKSGFCNSGAHEGERPKSFKGTPLKTCPCYEWCGCECHVLVDQMFQASGRERILITNPDYVPYQRDYWMPTPEETIALAVASRRIKLDAEEPPEFKPTPTGVTPKGQLEYWVKEACDFWRAHPSDDLPTTKWISLKIAATHNVTPPSLGAIRNILLRWQEIGYAEVAQAPLRFLTLTIAGYQQGLDKLKEKARR